MINCTGPSRDLRTGFPPLLASLCDRGLARPDPLGMGLEVDTNGLSRHPGREGDGRLFAMGPLLKGQYWETTAVRELRQQAVDLARNVARNPAGCATGSTAPEARLPFLTPAHAAVLKRLGADILGPQRARHRISVKPDYPDPDTEDPSEILMISLEPWSAAL